MNKILPVILPLQLTLHANLLGIINVNLMKHRSTMDHQSSEKMTAQSSCMAGI